MPTKENVPVLYDHNGRAIERSVSELDPYFLRSGRTGGTGAYNAPAAREPYKYHSWIFACVDRVMTPTAALPRILVDKADPSTVIKSHPLYELFSRPNPMMCGTDLWEATFSALLLPTQRTPGGQCFWILESGRKGEKYDLQSGDMPTEIWPFSDQFVEPIIDGLELTGWKLVIGGKTMQEFGFNEVIRFRRYNPYNMSQGISPFAPAEIPVIQDVKSDEFNTRFYDNYGAVGGALTTDSDLIDAKQLKEFADWFDSSYAGSGNAGRTVALSHGLKYDRFMLSNLDMQFAEQRKDNRQRIQAVYGVNDAELGIFDSGMNRATAEVADRAVWQKSRLPLDRKVMDTLNAVWIRWFKPYNMILKSDISQVEALQQTYSDRITDATKLIREGYVPPAEAFRVTGVPVDSIKYPWMEKVFAPMSLVDIELLADGAVFPSFGAQPPAKHLIDMLAAAAAKRHWQATTAAKDGDNALHTIDADKLARAVAAMDEEARTKMWEAYERAVLRPGEKTMRDMWMQHFYSQRNEMLDNVDAWEKEKMQSKSMVRELVVSMDAFTFDMVSAHEAIMNAYKGASREQMERELANLRKEYGDAIQWKVTEQNITKFVNQRERVIKGIDTMRFERARKEIAQTVSQAVNENMTVVETAKLLKQNINGLYPTNMPQATVIARTETASISNYSRYDAFEETKQSGGAQYHEWLSARDERVRMTHMIDGEVRRIGEAFSNGMTYPNDPAGSAAETINCRCITMLRVA